MSTPTGRESPDERRARVTEVRATQQKAERRRTRLIVLAVVAVLLALVIPATIVILNEQHRKDAVATAASAPIKGERTVKPSSAKHVSTDVPAKDEATLPASNGVLPPVGGDHDPQVQNCGFYPAAIRDANALHSLEHGAVWITYRPDVPDAQVQRLKELAAATPYLLVSPYKDLAAPIVASAWGIQLQVDSVDDQRLSVFVTRYVQGKQTPEPGAPCSGGVGS